MPKAELVQIRRGRYSPQFQVVRAWLSAASAIAHTNKQAALDFLDRAILDLQMLRADIKQAKSDGN
jgi:hypothetical protein